MEPTFGGILKQCYYNNSGGGSGKNRKVQFQDSILEKSMGDSSPEELQLLRFMIRSHGKPFSLDQLRELIVSPVTLNEIEHNLAQQFKLGLAVARAMVGVIGPYK